MKKRKFGLTMAQQTYRFVKVRGEATSREIGKGLETTSDAAEKRLRKAVKAGWLVYRTAVIDGRSWRLYRIADGAVEPLDRRGRSAGTLEALAEGHKSVDNAGRPSPNRGKRRHTCALAEAWKWPQPSKPVDESAE